MASATVKATFVQAFTAFMLDGFEDAVVSSTKASFGGGSYSVELFEDGTYRVQPASSFGNLYETPGIILKVPTLSDDDWDVSEEGPGHFFENAEAEMRDVFSELS